MPKKKNDRLKEWSKYLLFGKRHEKIKTKDILILLVACIVLFIIFGLPFLYLYGQGYNTLNNENIVETIVKDYHAAHTYSQPDFFVCSDMAIDVWNIVKSKGINAKIQVGNIENPNANFTDYNHAWVLAEVEPLKWLALETTGGYVVYENTNYYKGFSFDNPTRLKRYLELIRNYNAEISRINELVKERNICTDEYSVLSNEYNKKYVGKLLSNDGVESRAKVSEKLGQCNRITDDYNNENALLSNIVYEIKGLIGQ